MDAAWSSLLAGRRKDARSAEAGSAVLARAAELVRGRELRAPGEEVDVVATACGFKILYFLGAYTVLRAAGVEMVRLAGASSGGMIAAEIEVLGLERVVELYLSYGALQDDHGRASAAYAAWRADAHWLALSRHLFQQEDALQKLDGKVFLSVTRLTWRGPRNHVYGADDYGGDPERARRAYYATGTGLTTVDGYLCTDGGVTNATPTFTDDQRPQIVVRPPRTGLPHDMILRFSFDDATRAIQLGQDAALTFLLGDDSQEIQLLPPAAPTYSK